MKRFMRSPVFFILIAMVLLKITSGTFSNPVDWIMDKLMLLPAIIIGLSFHEFAHGFTSNALGDPTPKLQGRLTINPAAHIDPFGFIALLLAGFGWGIPVQVDPRYYKHRRRDEFLVSIAGVMMNLLIAILFAFIIKGLIYTNADWLYGEMGGIVLELLQNVLVINIVLMIFNLLPIPPLDGFGMVTEIFNLRKYDWYYKVYDKGFIILLILVLFNFTDFILTPAVNWVYTLIVQSIIM